MIKTIALVLLLACQTAGAATLHPQPLPLLRGDWAFVVAIPGGSIVVHRDGQVRLLPARAF